MFMAVEDFTQAIGFQEVHCNVHPKIVDNRLGGTAGSCDSLFPAHAIEWIRPNGLLANVSVKTFIEATSFVPALHCELWSDAAMHAHELLGCYGNIGQTSHQSFQVAGLFTVSFVLQLIQKNITPPSLTFLAALQKDQALRASCLKGEQAGTG